MSDADKIPFYDAPSEPPKDYPQKFVYPSDRTLPKYPVYKENK